MAIVGGEVHIGNGEVLEGATVVIEDGKITAVGRSRASEGAEVISAEGMVVTPGFIDAQTFLGTSPGEGGGLVSLSGDPDAAIVPQVRARIASPRTRLRCGSNPESHRSIWPPIRGS